MLADELIEVHKKPRQIAPLTERYPGLTPSQGYEAALALHRHRLTGAHPVSPADLWRTELSGLPLPGLTIRFK
jgi:hypothetical protein